MRGAVWLGVLVTCSVWASVGLAQSTPLEPVSLTPPPAEPGWTVRPLNGGYARWETDTSGGEQGGVQVVRTPEQETPAPPEAKAEGDRVSKTARQPRARPLELPCEENRRRLAVRLLELRGIEATEESAPYVLAAMEAPLWPQAWAGVPGLGPGTGSSLLATAYSSDLITRDLVDELTRCLAEVRTPVRAAIR